MLGSTLMIFDDSFVYAVFLFLGRARITRKSKPMA
jgi:hypothetical protein